MIKPLLTLLLLLLVRISFAGDSVVVNSSIQYQTIKGWGGEGGQNTQYEGTPTYLISQIINESVNSLGLTGLRYESFQGNEAFSYGPHHTWEWTNDNGSPDTLVPSALDTGAIDYYMQNLFVPWKNKVVANGDPFNFYFSPSWYAGGSTGDIPAFLRYSPGEYAEYFISNLNYLKNRYGLVADYADMCNEAGNGNVFTAQLTATMIKTVAPWMQAAGLTTQIQFPECVNAQTSWQYIQAVGSDTTLWPYIKCLSYHLYGTDDPYRHMIDSFALTKGLITAQREYIGLGIDLLYQDLTRGGVSYWDFYGNGDYMPLNTNQTWFTYGAKYWTTRQVIHYNRPGCVRVSAMPNDTMLRCLAFTKNNTTSLVIINTTTGNVNQSVLVSGMVPGTYGYSETSGSGTHTELGLLTVAANGTVTVTVNSNMVVALYPHPANLPPLAISWAANPTYIESPATSVALSASGQDPELSTVSYHWTIDSFPAGASVSLSNANISNPAASGMTVAGNYVFSIHMSDGIDTTVKSLTVQAFSGNQPPIISTLQSRIPVIVTLPVDTTILQGFCFDIEADALTYQWSIVSQPAGANAVLVTPTAANRCTVRNMTIAGNYVFNYAVSDPTHTVSRDLTVPVFPINDTPVISSVSATPRTINLPLDSSLLSAVTSDPNSDIITHWWTVASAPAGADPSFSRQGERVTEVRNLTVPGTYVFLLTLIDRTLYTTKLDTVFVTGNACPTAAVTTTPSTCGRSNGGASVHLTGGSGSYTYAWSAGSSTTTTDTNLVAGNYTVTVTGSGCTVVGTGNVANISGPSAQITDSTTSCFGSVDGSIHVNASGGSVPYQYQLNNDSFQSSPGFNNLAAGSYTIYIKDNTGCIDTSTTLITQPTAVSVSVTTTAATTIGGSNGTATANASGGRGAYTYQWTNFSMQRIDSNLIAGTYCLTVVDAYGCTAFGCAVVGQPGCGGLVAQATDVNVNCYGSSTGQVIIQASGGTSPYQYKMTGSYQSGSVFNNLNAGTYEVYIKDNTGCVDSISTTITQPITALSVAAIDSTAPLCAGGSTGSFMVIAAGGTGPYSFSADGGAYQSSGNFTGQASGVHNIIVKDANGCTSVCVVSMSSPLPITAVNAVIDDSCFGNADGCITVTINGGTLPYTNSWSNGTTSPINCLLAAGTYSDTISDNNGCRYIDANIIVTSPPALRDTIIQDGPSLIAQAWGGTPYSSSQPYTYMWDGLPSSDTLFFAGEGSHTVIVSDANGCMTTATFIFLSIENVSAGISNFNVYPNPSDGFVTVSIQLSVMSDEMTIAVADMTGRTVYGSVDRNVKSIDKVLDLRSMSKGVYVISIKTDRGAANQRVILE